MAMQINDQLMSLAIDDRIVATLGSAGGPVLDLEDVMGGKVCALAGRVEPRACARCGRGHRHGE